MTHHPAPRRSALSARFMPAASSTAFVFAMFHQLAMPIMAALALALTFVAPAPIRAQPTAQVVTDLPASGTYNASLVGATGTHFIYNYAGTGTVTIQGTRTSHGGAVYFSLAGGYFTATSSNGGTIVFQTSGGSGIYAAGIYMNSSAALPARLDVTGAHFIENIGTGDTYGGGIWMQNAGGTILANYTLFDRNIANRGAGIGFATGNTLFAENAVFSNNRAANTTSGGYGGAIYSSGTSIIHLDNSKFSSNVASTSGGAIYGGGIVSARNTIFEGNYTIAQASSNSGGGFFFTSAGSGSLDLTGATFTDNTAGSGGALYVNAPANSVQFINASGATFTGNSAGQGGAIYFYINANTNSPQFLDISGATFKNNTARSTTGGAVTVRGIATGLATITATGAVFTGNAATVDVGGALRLEYSDIDLTGAVFTSNTAGRNGGGAVWLNTGNMDLTNTQFIDNTIEGTGWGGAVSITTSSTTTGTLRLGATAGQTSVFRGNTLGILRDDTMVAIPSAIDFGSHVITGTIISGDPDIPDVITYDYNYTQVLEVAVATGGVLDMQDPIRSRASGTTIATFDGGGLWKLGGTNSIGGYHFTDFTAISGTLALYAGAELGLWSTDHP
ncbi:MAG: hypothetical protein LBM04_00485, partial [Opitutaceae bacterium]|nr:hypothetical protein [Opitutaceae bacterium]